MEAGLIKRVQVQGPTGSGKTTQAVAVSLRYAAEKKLVAFIDLHEGGSRFELRAQSRALNPANPNELLQYVWRVDARDDQKREVLGYAVAMAAVKQAVASGAKLIVVDAAHHIVKLGRRYARMQYIRQGKYYMGEKEIIIDDPEGFELRGYLYDSANKRIDEFIDALVTSGADVLVTFNDEEVSQSQKGVFEGVCDCLLISTFSTDDRGNRTWFVSPLKFRGRPLASYARVALPNGRRRLNQEQPDAALDVFQFIDLAGSVPPETYAGLIARWNSLK